MIKHKTTDILVFLCQWRSSPLRCRSYHAAATQQFIQLQTCTDLLTLTWSCVCKHTQQWPRWRQLPQRPGPPPVWSTRPLLANSSTEKVRRWKNSAKYTQFFVCVRLIIVFYLLCFQNYPFLLKVIQALCTVMCCVVLISITQSSICSTLHFY